MTGIRRRIVQVLAVVGTVLGLLIGEAGMASATGTQFYVMQDGCQGTLLVTHNYNGTGHDAVRGYFLDKTYGDAPGPGWWCSFIMQRSLDGGKTWYSLPGEYDGRGGQESPYIWDGPGFMARIWVESHNEGNTWMNINETSGY